MKSYRFSIAALMTFIVVIAMNLAMVSTLLASNNEMLLTGIALSGLVLQAVVIRRIRCRGRGRAFWAGFIACGMTAMMSFVYAMMVPRIVGYSRSTGRFEKCPGPPWVRYDNYVFEKLDPLLLSLGVKPGSISIIAVEAIVWTIPQLLIAAAGGLLALLMTGRRARNLLATIR